MKRNFARLGLSAAASVAALFTALPSQAQTFYSSGKVSVALERAFGIHYAHSDFDPPGPASSSSSATAIGFGWYGAVTPLHWTRAAIDGFVTDRLSLGGSLAFFTQTGDAEGDGVLFAPRVGYAIPLSSVFTFWPRGGITFLSLNQAFIADGSLFGLSAEAMFVASPKPNWGILFGPSLDFGFIGESQSDVDWTHFSLGIPTVGLMATF
jgi:hypothetical protein